jgi:hypothetical protein
VSDTLGHRSLLGSYSEGSSALIDDLINGIRMLAQVLASFRHDIVHHLRMFLYKKQKLMRLTKPMRLTTKAHERNKQSS